MKFSPPAVKILGRAREEAHLLTHVGVEPCHLLLALLHRPTGPVRRWCARMGVEPFAIRLRVRERLVPGPAAIHQALIPFSAAADGVLRRAEKLARRMGHLRVGPEHLLIATLARPDEPSARALEAAQVRYQDAARHVKDILRELPHPQAPARPQVSLRDLLRSRGLAAPPPLPRPPQAAGDPYLTDLTHLIALGVVDADQGRTREAERAAQVLSLAHRRGFVLIGPWNYGTWPVLHALAKRMDGGAVTFPTPRRRLWVLEFDRALQDFATDRSRRERLESLVERVVARSDAVIAVAMAREQYPVPDLELLVGMLDRILQDSTTPCALAAPTAGAWEELRRRMAFPEELERIFIPAMMPAETLDLLRRQRRGWELRYLACYEPDALKACVEQAAHLAPVRRMPESAVDLMVEVAARTRRHAPPLPPEIAESYAAFLRTERAYDLALRANDHPELVRHLERYREVVGRLWDLVGSVEGRKAVVVVPAVAVAEARREMGAG